MGCGASNSNHSHSVSPEGSKFRYRIFVHLPEADTPFEFLQTVKYSSIPLPALMNVVAFDVVHSREFNANFISVFNKETKTYNYFVQRLAGVEIENEEKPYSGKIWVPYINGERFDWNDMCENEKEVTPDQKIEWMYESYTK